MRKFILSVALTLIAVPAFAQGLATKVEGIGTSASPTGGALSVNCVSGCSGGGGSGNVTIIGPLGSNLSAASVSVVIASDQAAVPVTIATVPLPTGAATAANQTNVQSAPGTPQTTAITIQGNSSGVGVPVTAASLPLPTGAATAGNQTTGNSSLSTIATNTTNAGTPTLQSGSTTSVTQTTAANLNATVVGTGTFAAQLTGATNNINNISGTISLPTGASTSALQTTGNTSLATIATNTTNAGTPTLQSGSTTAVTQATAANLKATVTGLSATYVASTALVANQVIIGSAHQLLSFDVAADSTLSGAAWWIMIYDATSAPSDGAVTPAKCYALPSGATSFNGAFNSPVAFTTGIVIGVSTTGCFTKTQSVHAFVSGDYQ